MTPEARKPEVLLVEIATALAEVYEPAAAPVF